MAIVGRAKYRHARARNFEATRREGSAASLRVASPRNFARARVYFARPTIAIAKIRDYSQSKGKLATVKSLKADVSSVSPRQSKSRHFGLQLVYVESGVYPNSLIRSDEGLTLETSAFSLFMVANLPYQSSL